MLGRVFLGRYETVRLLGEGGMGRVYLAQQTDLGRQVVVKVMHDHIAADPKFRDRFTRETLLMARFQHPYAVALYDASSTDPNGPCIVMEYIRGVTLDIIMQKNGRLNPLRVGRLLGQLCEVLQAAHDANIIHRDLKPANLMIVDPETNHEIVKVMDFGLAKLIDGADMRVTASNTEFAVGTPGYMCPEQARGEEMDHRGDLYSVGILLFEMLTGRLPFAASSTMEMLLAHAAEEPPSFSAVGAAGCVPYAIEQLVHDCLAKEPADRPATARELAERYQAALGGGTSTLSTGPVATPKTPRPSKPALLAPTHIDPDGQRPAQPSGPLRALLSGRVAIMQQPTVALPTTSDSTPLPLEDPLTFIKQMDAWMPERIATYKLRGFIDDAGGEMIESTPGQILVRLGGQECVYTAPKRTNSFAWLGLGRKATTFEMELRLKKSSNPRENLMHITLILRSSSVDITTDPNWQKLCGQIYCDLRAYLMAQGGAVPK